MFWLVDFKDDYLFSSMHVNRVGGIRRQEHSKTSCRVTQWVCLELDAVLVHSQPKVKSRHSVPCANCGAFSLTACRVHARVWMVKCMCTDGSMYVW